MKSFMENSCNDELFCSLKDELREVNAQINVHSEKLMDLLDQKKRIVSQLTREMSHLTPVIIEYRGNPKQYVSWERENWKGLRHYLR